MAAIPITVWKVRETGGANTPSIRRHIEKSAQTFLIGTPVQVTSGYLIEQPTINGAHLVAGIAHEPASNLTTDATAKTLTYGSVQNQAHAVLIPGGAPPNDGTCGFVVANGSTEFKAKLGTDQTSAVTNVGSIFGLTKQANGFWYVDTTITAAGSGAVCEVTELIDPAGTTEGLVAFRFTQAAWLFER